MRKKSVIALCVVFIMLGKNAVSQNAFGVDDYNVISTAVPILLVSPDARSGGMGDAGVAALPDVNSIFWNPEALIFAMIKEIQQAHLALMNLALMVHTRLNSQKSGVVV